MGLQLNKCRFVIPLNNTAREASSFISAYHKAPVAKTILKNKKKTQFLPRGYTLYIQHYSKSRLINDGDLRRQRGKSTHPRAIYALGGIYV